MFWRRRTDDDFSKEVQAHLDLETDRLIAEGSSPAEARDAARRAFGNVTRVKERFYEALARPALVGPAQPASVEITARLRAGVPAAHAGPPSRNSSPEPSPRAARSAPT